MSSNLLEIIIKAQDQASSTANKVGDQLKKIGDTAKIASQKAVTAEQLHQQKLAQTQATLSQTVSKFNDVGNKGAESFKRLSSSQQDSIIKFNMLDKETQTTLQAIRELGTESMDLIPGADEAIAKLASMDDKVKTFGGSFDYAKSKMELMGNSTETIKGKIQAVGMGIQTYIGNKWDSVKSKVSSLASFISTSLTTALSKVRSGIDALGGAFSGLGGLISTAIGMVGMSSIKDMTIGLAMNRERMTALTSATMGGAEAGKQFVDVMDNLTNNSLVSLDDLGQAMSTIKMSTGMTNEELKNFTTTVNDVGQRAILMGKSGDEAMALMQAAGRGLNGEFDMLKTNFGITREQLEDLGWSGAADDVEGYQKALDEALEKGGSMNGMMDTSVGHLETLKKNFRIAGRHVGEMFTPYIDQAVQYLNKLNDTCPGLFENMVMIAGAVSGFATIAPSLSPMLGVFDGLKSAGGSALGLLKTGVGTVRAFHGALAAGEGIQAAVSAGFTAMGASELLALWPLALIAAALIAITAVVYEVGKSFGWWSDIPSFLSAICDGLRRMWEAFINHPDVQAAIALISSALSTLWSWIQQAGQAVLEFFGISSGSDWDAVRTIIEGIGLAWQVLTFPIRTIISLVQMAMGAFGSFYNGTLMPLGEYIMGILSPVFETLGTIWTGVIEQISGVVSVFQAFQAGQVDLVTVITTVATTLWNIWLIIATNLLNLVMNLAGQLLTWAIQAGLNFLTGIGIYLSQLPGRVANYLLQTTRRIISAGLQWVSRARNAASQLVSGVVNFLAQLPGRAYSKLVAVVSRIVSAGQQWISNAVSKASELVTNVTSKLGQLPDMISSALSGVVNAIVSPFKSAYDSVCSVVDSIKSKVSDAMNAIASLGSAAGGDHPAGGEFLATGGETAFDTIKGSSFNIHTGEYVSNDEPLEIEEKITLILDFKNVPSDMNVDNLIKYLTDPQVLQKLVENPKFQELDAKVKRKIEAKVRRSRGV